MFPGIELLNCQGLAVPMDVMKHVVSVESSFNPYAIGVVGGRLVRQPMTLGEALSTVRMLEKKGYNFSLGLAQVNRYNLGKWGLPSYEAAFQPCANLLAGSRILAECRARTDGDWGKALSCYYSGNTVTGFRHGYVQKVFASMRGNGMAVADAPIQVREKPSRKVVPVSRYPVQAPARTADVEVTPARVRPLVAGTADGNVSPSGSVPAEPVRRVPDESPGSRDRAFVF